MLKTKETELVDFLVTLDKTYIDELIDILTDFGKGRVALNSTVKDVLTYETEFTKHRYNKEIIELILTEFQKFGGNSLYNLVRGDLVSYDEILNDVYAYVLTNNLPNENIEKEKAILSFVLGEQWKNISFKDRYESSSNNKWHLKKTKELIENTIGSGFISGLLRRTLAVPGAGVVVGSHMLSEAYRITIPFIIQISWLKQKFGFYSPKDKETLQSQEGLSIALYNDICTNGIKNNLDDDSISNLNQLFSVIPNTLIKTETLQNNYAIVNIPLNKLTSAKDGDGLRGMVHGVNKNGHFGITENVRIYEPDALSKLVNTGLLMNLASTLVAQKHLADISQKLDDIKKGIGDIKGFLTDKRNGKINAAFKDAQDVFLSLQNNEKSKSIPEKIQDLRNHRFELKQIIEHIKKEIEDKVKKIQAVKFDSFLNTSNSSDIKALSTLFLELDSDKKSYELCIHTLLAIYGIFNHFDRFEREDMITLIDEAKNFLNDQFNLVYQHLEKIKKNSKSITNFESTELANLAFFTNREFSFKETQKLSIDNFKRFGDNFNQLESVNIAVLIEDKVIKEAQVLAN